MLTPNFLTSKDVKLLDGYSKASKDKNGRLIVGGSIGIKGRHTELVTVYVPGGFNLDLIRSQLAD